MLQSPHMSDFIFFRLLPEIILDNNADSTQIKYAYYDGIKAYREGMLALRDFDPKTVSLEKIHQIDRERNNLHSQIKRLGNFLGITDKEIFAELMLTQETLEKYQLPEFHLVSRDDLTIARSDDRLNSMMGYEPDEFEEADYQLTDEDDHGNQYATANDLKKGEFGILFERSVRCAVRSPNPDIFTTRGNLLPMIDRGSEERIRRAKRFAADHGFKLLHYSEFMHEYTEDIIAIVVDEDTFQRAVNLLEQNRNEYGIRLNDMDPEIVERDWQESQTYIEKKLAELSGQLGPFVHVIYDNAWNKTHTPNYRDQEQAIIESIEKQGYTFDGDSIKKKENFAEHVSRKGLKSKERRQLERQNNEDDPASEKNPFKKIR
jgi:hypothetical protein